MNFINDVRKDMRSWECIFVKDLAMSGFAASIGVVSLGDPGIALAAIPLCNLAKSAFSRLCMDADIVNNEISFWAVEVTATALIVTITTVSLAAFTSLSMTFLITASALTAGPLLIDTAATYLLAFDEPPEDTSPEPNIVINRVDEQKYIDPHLQILPKERKLRFPNRPSVDLKTLLEFCKELHLDEDVISGIGKIVYYTEYQVPYREVPEDNEAQWYRDFHNILATIINEVELQKAMGTLDRDTLKSELIDFGKIMSNECGGGWRFAAVGFYKAISNTLIDSEEACFENALKRLIVKHREGLLDRLLHEFIGVGDDKIGIEFQPHIRNLYIKLLTEMGVRFSSNFMLDYDPLDPVVPKIFDVYFKLCVKLKVWFLSASGRDKLIEHIIKSGLISEALMDWAEELCPIVMAEIDAKYRVKVAQLDKKNAENKAKLAELKRSVNDDAIVDFLRELGFEDDELLPIDEYEAILVKVDEKNVEARDRLAKMNRGLKDDHLDDFLRDCGFVDEESMPTAEGFVTVLEMNGLMHAFFPTSQA